MLKKKYISNILNFFFHDFFDLLGVEYFLFKNIILFILDMESHVLNIYHHAQYRTMDHKIMRSTSESEGSCNQNSPEYSQEQASSQYEEESNVGNYWNAQNRNLWSQNQKVL